MYTHYQSNTLQIHWTLYRGVSHTKENFSGAKVVAFVFSKTGKWFVPCYEADGSLTLTVLENLPVGVYSLEAVWTKNQERSVSRAIYDAAFAVTDIASEATFRGGAPDPDPLALHSSAGSFGYDGLSAYELAVMKGMTTKSEDEWVASAVNTAEAEEARTLAENVRVSAEQDRAAAEADRANSFNDLQRDMQIAIVHNLESLEQTVTTDVSGGVNVITATMLDGTSTTFEVRNGQQGSQGPKGDKGDKGDQGNSGYTGAAGELEIVNNLTDGGATAALSAEMGKDLGYVTSTVDSEMDKLRFKESTAESSELLGFIPTLGNGTASGRTYMYSPAMSHDIYLDKIIFSNSYTGTSFKIGYGDYTVDEENVVTATGVIVKEVTDIRSEDGKKVAYVGGIRIPQGKFIAICGGTYYSQEILVPDGDNKPISFADNPSLGPVTEIRSAKYMYKVCFHLVYHTIPTGDEIRQNAEDIEKVNHDMNRLYVETSTADSSELLDVTTQLGTRDSSGLIFYYNHSFKDDVYLDKLILPSSFSQSSFKIGYGTYTIDQTDNTKVICTGKVLAVIDDIRSEGGYKVAYIGGLKIPKNNYLAAEYLIFKSTTIVNPDASNGTIGFPTATSIGDVTLTKVANQILEYGFHLVYHKVPTMDSILNKFDALESELQKEISILFFGNSLTQDATAYVPWMLKTLAPTVKFRIVNFYRGGKTVAQQLAFLNDPTHSDTSGGFSVRKSTSESPEWTDVTSSWETVLAEGFNHITIQEYTNNVSTFDYTNYPLLIEKLRTICGTSAKFHHFMEKTLNGDATRYARAESFAHIAYSTQAVDSIVNPGTAFDLAWDNDTLHALITSDTTYTDTTHAEEGLPCYVEALVMTRWVFDQLGLQTSILNNDLILNSTIYDAMGSHGANVGTNGPIYGSTAEQLLGQEIAQTAWNQRKRIELGLSNS